MEALVDPRNLLTALIAVLTFATLFTLLGSMTGGAKLEGRMKAVADRKEELKRRSRQQIAQQAQQGGALRQTDDGFKKRIVDRLKEFSEAGADGIVLTFVNYEEGLETWMRDVAPLLVQAGLREG